MSNNRNGRYTMKVHGTRRDGRTETLVLTFNNRQTAMTAYFNMPKHLDCDRPEEERHAIYRSADDAVDCATQFFA